METTRIFQLFFLLIFIILVSACKKENSNIDSHTPPFCSFLDPDDNSKFTQGVEITLQARAENRDSDLSIERFLINDAIVYETNSSVNGWFEYDWQTINEEPGLYEIRFQAIDSAESISEDTILIELLPADTIEDIEGNRYRTIQITDQTWMAENLKTTTYNDGTPIELISNNNNWEETLNGAFCWYENNEVYTDTYGILYNWYAIETEKLCPEGWSVPTLDDWELLEENLANANFTDLNGDALKAETGWVDNSGFDYYGFKALPGGYRSGIGQFYLLGCAGRWWSSTTLENSAFFRELQCEYSLISGFSPIHKSFGFSVRCIKN